MEVGRWISHNLFFLRGFRALGAGVAGACKLPMGAGNGARAHKSRSFFTMGPVFRTLKLILLRSSLPPIHTDFFFLKQSLKDTEENGVQEKHSKEIQNMFTLLKGIL